jgi:hypothetical protein
VSDKPRSRPKAPSSGPRTSTKRASRQGAAQPAELRSREDPRASTLRGGARERNKDVVLIQGVSEDGEALAVLRAREDRIEAGIVRALKEGELGKGELVRLKPRAENPLVCDVEVELPERALNARGGSDRSGSPHGPAQVATPSYRANWDAIWKKPSGSKKNLPN